MPIYLVFSFTYIDLRDWSMIVLLWFMPENVLLMFSSRDFMVSCFVLKSLSHFEFIFMYGMRACFNFIDLQACGCLALWTPVAEETVFSALCILASFVKYELIGGMWVSFWTLFHAIDSYVCFCASTTLFCALQLYIIVWIQKGLCLQLCSFPSGLLWP